MSIPLYTLHSYVNVKKSNKKQQIVSKYAKACRGILTLNSRFNTPISLSACLKKCL